VAFTNTYSTIRGGYLATNASIKKYAKKDLILLYLLRPDCLQFAINSITPTS